MNNLTRQPVYFVCDANVSSGMGHFLRCISLATQLRQQKYEVIFVGEFSAAAQVFAKHYSIQLQLVLLSVAARLQSLPPASRVVLDSYQYCYDELPYQHRYVLIDDFCLQNQYPVAGVINFTYQAHKYNYCDRGARHQALGLDYYLAHPALTRLPAAFSPEVRRILVLIGSGDPYQLSAKIVASLRSISLFFEIKVAGSTLHPTGCGKVDPALQYVPPIPDVSQYYDWADFCITSGGLAKYECAYLGKPAAVISLTAAEQSETDGFAASQLCFDLGYHSNIEPDRLIKDLAQIILQPQIRLAAHHACLQAFSGHSSQAITEFVTRCWEHSA